MLMDYGVITAYFLFMKSRIHAWSYPTLGMELNIFGRNIIYIYAKHMNVLAAWYTHAFGIFHLQYQREKLRLMKIEKLYLK